jgi:hypothetical protein
MSQIRCIFGCLLLIIPCIDLCTGTYYYDKINTKLSIWFFINFALTLSLNLFYYTSLLFRRVKCCHSLWQICLYFLIFLLIIWTAITMFIYNNEQIEIFPFIINVVFISSMTNNIFVFTFFIILNHYYNTFQDEPPSILTYRLNINTYT